MFKYFYLKKYIIVLYNMIYSNYEYFYQRSCLVSDVGKPLSENEYNSLSTEERDDILNYLMYVSRKIILESDVFVEDHGQIPNSETVNDEKAS